LLQSFVVASFFLKTGTHPACAGTVTFSTMLQPHRPRGAGVEGTAMAEAPNQANCLISGRHRPARVEVDPCDPSIQRSRCLRCGHAITRSLVSRRWIVSAYLGSADQAAAGEGKRR
jgi:hypothetical protein